jgi:hypothetical protein
VVELRSESHRRSSDPCILQTFFEGVESHSFDRFEGGIAGVSSVTSVDTS